MLDEQAAQNFFEQMNEYYIQPEINKRKSEGNLPEDFKMQKCLIRFPHTDNPIVEFNNEFGWLTEHPELAPGVNMEVGKPIYLHEIVNLGKVLPPTYQDQRVAFVFVYWAGHSYQAVFDFSPNWPDFDPLTDDFSVGHRVEQHLNLLLIELTIKSSVTVQNQLEQIGLWPATSLLPFPISKIIARVGNGNLEEARAVLVDYCDADFIKTQLIDTRNRITVFKDRRNIFEQSLFSHRNAMYISAIHTLVPQIEGVITDWLHQIPELGEVKWKIDSKINQFHLLITKTPQLEFSWKTAWAITHQFLSNAQPMKAFRNWADAVDTTFPGRHPVSHGKYDEAIYTEENSIKLFLLLDTICQFMMFYEVRVLGRDLTQNDEDNE